MNNQQAAWWAGLWEGRGTLSYRMQRSGTGRWKAMIVSSNEPLIRMAQQMLGGAIGAVSTEVERPRVNRAGDPIGGMRPRQYRLTIENRADLQALLRALLPMLTPERRAEADQFLTWVPGQRVVPRRPQGVRRRT